jgi:phosphonate transport system substrate-binding protein
MRLIHFGLLFLVAFTVEAADVQTTPLRVGLLPYVSTQRLIERYAPLREYLENALQRKVILVTAPDFKTYIDRANNREYDLYLTAPHFAAFAEQHAHYRRVSRLLRDLQGTFIVANDGTINTIEDLKGKIVTAPDTMAIVTMLGETLLEEHGLVPGKNLTVEYTLSHNNAILAVASGKADAAVTAPAVFDTMPLEIKEKLRVLTVTKKVPNMMFMGSPNLPEPEFNQLREAMLNFTANGPGKAFFEKTSYVDMGEITDEQMRQLRPYVEKLQRQNKN